MNSTAFYMQVPPEWPTVPDHALHLATERALIALGNEGSRPVSQRLADYYDIEADYVGTSLTELAPNEWHDLTAADLHAMSLTDVKVGPRATRRMLSGPERTWVIEALRRLPDRDLLLADCATLEAMYDFYGAVTHALSDPNARTSDRSVTASKLAARKRPDLFPALGRVVCEHLRIFHLNDVRCEWQVFRALMQDDRIQRALQEIPDAVTGASAGRTLVLDTSDLRLLDAALWTYARGGAPERSLGAREGE